MGKPFAIVEWNEIDLSEIIQAGFTLEHIVFIEADRGPLWTPVLIRGSVNDLRKTFGTRPAPAGVPDTNWLAVEHALNLGTSLWVVRLTHLATVSDPTSLTALQSTVDVADIAATAAEYTFYLSEYGVGGDNFTVTVAANAALDDGGRTTFDVTLSSSESLVEDEVYTALSITPQDSRYFELILNVNNSGRLRSIDNNAIANDAAWVSTLMPAPGAYALAGGDEPDALVAGDIIGDAGAKTGHFAATDVISRLQVFTAFQFLSLDLAAVDHKAVVVAGGAWATEAVVYLSEPPDSTSPSDAADWANGEGIHATPLNSSYIMIDYGRPLIFDTVTGVQADVPVFAERAKQLTDAFDQNLGGAFWLAPAGLKRGSFSSAILGILDDVGPAPRRSDANLLTEAGINPIVSRNGQIRVWGNLTRLNDNTSLLINAHVRFAMLGFRKILEPLFDNAIFDPNEPVTWKALSLDIIPILRQWVADGAIAGFIYNGDQNAQSASDPSQLTVNNVNDIAAGLYVVQIVFQLFSAIDQKLTVRAELVGTNVLLSEIIG